MEIDTFYEKIGLTKGLKDKTIILQGYGNVGYWAGKFFEEEGAKIIGIVEYNSAVYNPDGISVAEAKDYWDKHGNFEGFPGAKEQNVENP